MNAQKLGWDDLRTVLAVGRSGSLSGAARGLGVTHSTVFRRVAAIEKRLGARLFERMRSGYGLTPAGEAVMEAARRVENEVDTLERRITGQDIRLTGSLRVTTTDTLALSVLPTHLAEFRRRYPDIEIELAIGNPFVSLTRREADVAIRPTHEPPDTSVGRRLCDVATAFYAAAGTTLPTELGDHLWIMPDESLSHLPSAKWLRRHHPEARTALRCNSLLGLLTAATRGMGTAPLPCFLGDAEPGLVRLGPPQPEFTTGLWLLTHTDLRRTARVRAFLDFITEALTADRDLFEGRRAERT